jgi:uncharacterized membrane protein
VQWILLLAGLFVGAALDGSLISSAVGALLGLTAGLALRVWSLGRQSADHQQQLAQTEKTLASLQLRLVTLESSSVQPPQTSPPTPVADPLPEPLNVQTVSTAGPELIWDLPDVEQALPNAGHDAGWRQSSSPRGADQTGAQPNLFDSALLRAKDWLLGGNTVLRVGVVLLFLGLAFLLRYATEDMVVPIEARYAGVAVSALALLGLGWWLRLRNAAFALTLQGVGIAVLYLTVFASMKLHTLMTPAMAFGLLLAVTVCSAVLAVTQNALALACVAALGGFAAPLLTSTGDGSHVALFSYFALLNAGIFAIAWFKAWRVLNLIGFVGTFGIGFAWGLSAYTPALFWSTEPFLIVFFLMYLAIGLLFARRKLQEHGSGPAEEIPATGLRRSAKRADFVDGSLLFGTPIAGFGLQYALVEHIPFGAAFSALAMGMLYMAIARLLAGRVSGRASLLVETCLAIGVVFATLAIPLGLDAQWTTVAWAIEGAAVFWLGLRQDRVLARGFGLLLQLGAGACCFGELNNGVATTLDRGDFWTPLLIALAGLVSAWTVHRIGTLRFLSGKVLQPALLLWGALWWAVALCASSHFITGEADVPYLLLAGAISGGLWTLVALRLQWAGLAQLCTLLTPWAGALLLLEIVDTRYNPLAHWGWLGWLAVFTVHFLSLRRLASLMAQPLLNIAHTLGGWLIISVLSLALRYALLQLSEHYNAWRWLGWSVLPSLFLLAMTSPRQWSWPVSDHPTPYRVWAAAPLAALMLVWFWLANGFSDGAANPLPYLPLVNPLELGLLLALAGVCLWTRQHLPSLGLAPAKAQKAAPLVAGVSLFALVTATVMRTAHHWANVPWEMDALLSSMRVQAGLSIVWTLMALTLMIGGHLRALRPLWLAGAALIGVVVAKLFLVELSDQGGLERIVSFIGVGILLLVVGYFAPLPPKTPTRTSSPEEPATESARS